MAALAVFALAGCGPDATPAKPNRLVGAPSASASPSESPTLTPAVETPAVTAPVTDVPVPVVTTQPAPVRTTAAVPKPTTQKPPPPKPTTHAPAPARTVTPGAFCSPEGAVGVTSTGKAMRCTLKAGEDRARWRAA